MSANLLEFMKVFSIVFTFSALLLMGHNYMSSLDDKDGSDNKEKENLKKTFSLTEKVMLDRKNILEPDSIDYDGMGNQGRFPQSHTK